MTCQHMGLQLWNVERIEPHRVSVDRIDIHRQKTKLTDFKSQLAPRQNKEDRGAHTYTWVLL